ncbi:MAG: recombinase [Bacteroidota bacterium]|nr:recombinase [Bacteroidota bacterium]
MKNRKNVQNKEEYLNTLFKEHFQDNPSNRNIDVEFLVNIVDVFRPKDVNIVYDINLKPLLSVLKDKAEYRLHFAEYLKKLFYKKDFDQIISDAGILNDNDFVYEVRKRLVAKVLPYQPPKHTLQYILNQVFYSSTDPQWIERVSDEQLSAILELLEFNNLYQSESVKFNLSEVIYGIEILTHRVLGRAMETEVNKMVPEFQNFDSPFIALQREFVELNTRLLSDNEDCYITSDDLNYKQILVLHKQCENYVKSAFQNSHKYGISIKVNQSLLRIRQQLARIKEVLPFLVIDSQDDFRLKSMRLVKLLIAYNCNKNDIKKLVNESTQLLSYEITQHTARTGEHYITSNTKEYFKMFWSACGGGFIVAFACIFKLLLSKLDASNFGYAFVYSMNYAMAFIVIYICGYTLATKQPAMTASALISALEQGIKDKVTDSEDKYRNFAVFFSRVFRSQFIAFVGNVIMAFPVALLLIWLIDLIFKYNIAEQKWLVFMTDLSPIHSPAIFHSIIAGFFLFISGIIAGSIANRDKHHEVYYRIQEHPILKKTIGRVKTKKLAKIYEKKWPGIISNFWFGVFMGSTASIGVFIGLDLDIRHITFASGNLALGVYGADFHVSLEMLLWGVFGVGIIGLVNFLVSFTLSLSLAFRSRNISLLELRGVASSIWSYFKEKPLHFFFPPKSKLNNKSA